MLTTFLFLIACANGPKQPEQPAPKSNEATKDVSVAKKAPASQKNANGEKSKDGFTDFGKPFTLEKTIQSSALLNKPEAFVGKKIRVEGKVTDVCQKMGCWLVITDDEKSMRITTKGHKFFVAKDGTGSRCHIEGEVIARAKDPSRTAHFESESSKGAPIPENQTTGDKTYEITASSIRFFAK